MASPLEFRAHKTDLRVATLNQFAGGTGIGLHKIAAHVTADVVRLTDEDDRGVDIFFINHLLDCSLSVIAPGVEDHSRGVIPQHPSHCCKLMLDTVLGSVEKNRVVIGGGRFLESVQHVGEERIGGGRQDQADRVGFSVPQAGCDGIRRIAQFRRRCLDPGNTLFADPGIAHTAAQHTGDDGIRAVSLLCDRLQCGSQHLLTHEHTFVHFVFTKKSTMSFR